MFNVHIPTFSVSKPAPEWKGTAVVNGSLQELKLKDFRGKYLVFFFYPLDLYVSCYAATAMGSSPVVVVVIFVFVCSTFVCPTEILAFNDRIEEFRMIGAEVVAASVDSHFTHLAWVNTPRKDGGLGKLSIPLLSDMTHGISKDYGVYLSDVGHSLRYYCRCNNFIIIIFTQYTIFFCK